MVSHGPALSYKRSAPGAYDLFPQASVSTWIDGLQAKIHAGLSGQDPVEAVRPLSPLRARSPHGLDHHGEDPSEKYEEGSALDALGSHTGPYANGDDSASQPGVRESYHISAIDRDASGLSMEPSECSNTSVC